MAKLYSISSENILKSKNKTRTFKDKIEITP